MARASSRTRAETAETSPYNVVLLVLDTARAKSVSPSTMPNLHRIASQNGVRFTNAFATAPWTLPSHASMFTGTYVSTHGATGDHPYLRHNLRTLAECFSDAGYETVGISNNTWITEEFGFARGFETFRRAWQVLQADVDIGAVVRSDHLRGKLAAAKDCIGRDQPARTVVNILLSELRLSRGDKGASPTTEWIEGWLRYRSDERPFFLFANYIEPHIPYRPPETYAKPFLPTGTSYDEAIAIRQDPRAYDVGEYDISDHEFELLRGLYRGELAHIDEHVARVERALKRTGRWDDTVFLVCSDHGENVGEHGLFGHQYNLFDTVIHVPLVIAGGAVGNAAVRDEVVGLHDLPATLLSAAGVADTAFDEQHDGAPLLDEIPDRPGVVSEYVAPQPSPAQLEERFGTIPDHVWAYDRRLRSIRTDRYHLIVGSDGHRALYDVKRDPDETEPISAPTVVRDLEAALDAVASPPLTQPSGEQETIPTATREHLAKLGYL